MGDNSLMINTVITVQIVGNFHSFFHLLREIAGPNESSNNNGDDYEYFLRLDDSLPNRKGASEEQIERIPLKKLSTPPNRTCCCICLEEFATGNDVKTLPCEHYFHPEVRIIDRFYFFFCSVQYCE